MGNAICFFNHSKDTPHQRVKEAEKQARKAEKKVRRLGEKIGYHRTHAHDAWMSWQVTKGYKPMHHFFDGLSVKQHERWWEEYTDQYQVALVDADEKRKIADKLKNEQPGLSF